MQSPEMTPDMARKIIGERKLEFSFDQVMALSVVANPTALLQLRLSETVRLGDMLNASIEKALADSQEVDAE